MRFSKILICLIVALFLTGGQWGNRVDPWGSVDYRWGIRQLSDIIPVSDIVDWWTVDEGVTKDGAGAVSHWLGSINGIDLPQSTGANQPIWTEDVINGHPAIVFNGTTQYLQGAFGAEYAQPNTVIIVCKNPTVNDDYIFDGLSAVTKQALYFKIVPNYILKAPTYAYIPSLSPRVGWNILSALFDGASSFVRENGVQGGVAGNVGDNPFTGLTLGSMYSGIGSGNISVTDIIVVSAGLGTGNLQRAERWINVHRGGVY